MRYHSKFHPRSTAIAIFEQTARTYSRTYYFTISTVQQHHSPSHRYRRQRYYENPYNIKNVIQNVTHDHELEVVEKEGGKERKGN